MERESLKPVRWIGSSLRDLRSFPPPVRQEIGHALYTAQKGKIDEAAKPMKGFGGGGVVEVVADHRGDTWRAVYTVRFEAAVYVLHVFQKKSKRGIATPKSELSLVQQRLQRAMELHAQQEG